MKSLIILAGMKSALSLNVTILNESLLDVVLVSRSNVLPHRVHRIDGLHEVSINVVHFFDGCNSLALC